MYKKCRTHDEDTEPVHNDEEAFAQQFFNFLRKTPQYVVQIPIPEINVASRSADSAPDKQKYSMDYINNPTPCTLFYIKGKKSMDIEVASAIMVTDHILHGQPIPIECAVVKVTTIREGHEFEDLDYPDKEERIVKLRDTKGTFML
jgi:hypothetical protein